MDRGKKHPFVEEIGNPISLPASKSIVNRLLIIEAITGKKILTPKDISCGDTRVLAEALSSQTTRKYIEQSGTAMRFLTAFLSIQKGEEFVLEGDERMSARPVGALVDALRRLGANIEYLHHEDYLPIKIRGGSLHGGTIEIDGSQSSQYVSALMLIAPTLEGGLRIIIQNPSSLPYILLTADVMRQMGVCVEMTGSTVSIPQSEYRPKQISVEADFSAAVFWYALFIVSPRQTMELRNLTTESRQSDSRIVTIAHDFGVTTHCSDSSLILGKESVRHIPKSVEYNLRHTPDIMPVLTVMCCMLGVEFVLSGLANLRIKESDRIGAMVEELAKCGYMLQATDDTVRWTPHLQPEITKPVTIDTHSDHRIAMAFALLREQRYITILSPEVVEKSYPDFWHDLTAFKANNG
jgi:3-phosphoshikimate 1-carboxyvinyltransferase